MASTTNFMFDNLTGINDDKCGLSQRNIQNVGIGNYLTTGYFNKDCFMKNQIDLATSQPGVFYTGSNQVGLGGCNIDESSALRMPQLQKELACQLDLNERPFCTVPYMGRGPVNCDTESHLLQGEPNLNKKSVSTITDKSFTEYSNYPLIPEVEKNVTNPNNIIQESASKDWIRGGLPSRDIYRDKEYFNGN